VPIRIRSLLVAAMLQKQIPITFPFLELSRNEGLRIISFIDLSACKAQAGQPEVKKGFEDAKRAVPPSLATPEGRGRRAPSLGWHGVAA